MPSLALDAIALATEEGYLCYRSHDGEIADADADQVARLSPVVTYASRWRASRVLIVTTGLLASPQFGVGGI